MKYFFVYALFDKANHKFYTGYASDLRSRIKEHLKSSVATTKRYSRPELVYFEACLSKKDAQRRERQLKTGFGRGYLKKRIADYLGDQWCGSSRGGARATEGRQER